MHMLWMAMFHLRWRNVCLKNARPKAIGGLVAAAAIIVMPNHLMAQSTSHPSIDAAFQSCTDQQTGLPVQAAMTLPGNIEPSAGPQPVSNAEAILGGQISKLEQMRHAQNPREFLGTTAAAELTTLAQIGRDTCGPPANLPFQLHSATPLPPNEILGSLSVPIAHTPFDRKWSVVNAKRGSGRVERLLAVTGAHNSSNLMAKVEAINRWVNRNIEFGEDRDIYGRADYWAPAAETFRRGVGDCEDFAIAKMELLAALGVTRDNMRLVVARDLVRNADHAVLVVALSEGPVMLDNMTDHLLDARVANDYRPIMSFSQHAKWVHGYAVQPPQPVRMASAAPLLPPASLRQSDVLTVTAEPEMPTLSLALLSIPLILPNGLSEQV